MKLNIELSKNDQRIEFGINATVAHINEDACWTLERASLALYFDAFRAPVTFGFDADTLLRLLWSESQLQKSQSVFREHCPQWPVAADIANLRLSIESWFRLGSHSLFFLSLLQSVAATAKPSGRLDICSWLALEGATMCSTLAIQIRSSDLDRLSSPAKAIAYVDGGKCLQRTSLDWLCTYYLTNNQTPGATQWG